MDKYNLFVRINYRANNIEQVKNNTRINNIKTTSSKYLIGSGILNKNGGNVIFTARTLNEVQQITMNNNFLKDSTMSYKVAMIPKEI